MKRIVITIILAVAIFTGYAQQKKYDIRDNWRLALTYYNAADYEKALPLLYNVYEKSRNETYFRYYISCMVKLKRYDEALEKIQKEIKKQRPPRPEYIIHKGYVLKQASRNAEAAAVFKEIIEKIPQNKASYIITGNAFTSWGEYDYARQTYLKGRKVLAPEKFSYELARASYFLHDYGQMLDYYLDLIGENKNRLNLVQNSLLSAMRQDIDNELRDKFREKLLKRIQSNPDITIYNRLLVWFFLQEKKFSSALRQLVALDRRTGKEDTQILQLGNAALNNHSYDDAQKAFDYLLKKGEKNTYYRQAYAMKIKAAYQQYETRHICWLLP
ncbi:MAG: hypothetical protein CSA36_02890 [Draconibacterium sp.]|nr:MAG: hypothetical protein CSA36_02890 [Draconibacterium sp.]